MSHLIKIREVSLKYDISARALKYYEDMGLINSARSDDYAYRMYDAAAIQRLEQILILRKLNISIKDIKRIFDTAGSEIVLEVLGKKVDGIDEEVSLLHELREIILEFIKHIQQVDFQNESDVKRLYDKAGDIEGRLINVEYSGNAANVNRLMEVSEKLDTKVPDVIIVKIPPFRALTSGPLPEDVLFGEFMAWNDAQTYACVPILFDGCDFFTFVEINGEWMFEWFWRVSDDVTETDVAPYKIVNQPGGLYALAMSVDGDGDSRHRVISKMNKWLELTNFERDNSRREASHMIYVGEEINKGLGYDQLNLYLPIKLKTTEEVEVHG